MLLVPAAVHADISFKAALAYMGPHNTAAARINDGNFGFTGEAEFHIAGTPPELSWAAGLDYFNLLSERAAYTDPFGFRVVLETTQDTYRAWFGPRLRVHEGFIRPYADFHISLAYNNIDVSEVVGSGGGELLVPVAQDGDFVTGYGMTAGLELRLAPTYSLDFGARYQDTFGQPQQLSYGSTTIHPTYAVYFIGVRWIIEEAY
jgi:hypothetical protein